MNRDDLNIWVLSHKDIDDLYDYEDCHKRMHIGAALNKETKHEYRDDIGNNISVKNPFFCELTGQYWVWKNADKTNNVGFEHYRRHFPLKSNEINNILTEYDIILPERTNLYTSIQSDYIYNHSFHDIHMIEKIIKDLYPEYGESWDKYMKGMGYMYYRNMFITNWENFDKLFTFIFDILNEFERRNNLKTFEDYKRHIENHAEHVLLEEHVKNGTTWKEYQLRLCGFISERLVTLWTRHNIPSEKIFEIKLDSSDKLIPVNKYNC